MALVRSAVSSGPTCQPCLDRRTTTGPEMGPEVGPEIGTAPTSAAAFSPSRCAACVSM
jgi:hypothetical protein